MYLFLASFSFKKYPILWVEINKILNRKQKAFYRVIPMFGIGQIILKGRLIGWDFFRSYSKFKFFNTNSNREQNIA